MGKQNRCVTKIWSKNSHSFVENARKPQGDFLTHTVHGLPARGGNLIVSSVIRQVCKYVSKCTRNTDKGYSRDSVLRVSLVCGGKMCREETTLNTRVNAKAVRKLVKQ